MLHVWYIYLHLGDYYIDIITAYIFHTWSIWAYGQCIINPYLPLDIHKSSLWHGVTTQDRGGIASALANGEVLPLVRKGLVHLAWKNPDAFVDHEYGAEGCGM